MSIKIREIYTQIPKEPKDQLNLIVGRVADKKDYGSWFHVGQSVLLEMREPVNPGQKLTIINDMDKLLCRFRPFFYRLKMSPLSTSTKALRASVEVKIPSSPSLSDTRALPYLFLAI